MPRIDGDRVFEYMRARRETSRIPIVILSGTLVEDRGRVLTLGADAYVAKGPRDRLRQNVLTVLRRLEGGEPGAGPEVLGLENLVPHEKVRELLAIRLAPCSPEQDTSPIAYSPGTSVRPCRSMSTPPQV